MVRKLNVSDLNDYVCLSKHLHRSGSAWGINWRRDSVSIKANGSGLNKYLSEQASSSIWQDMRHLFEEGLWCDEAERLSFERLSVCLSKHLHRSEKVYGIY